MKHLPKFLLCTNEAAQPGAAFILHTEEPRMLCEVKRLDGGGADIQPVITFDELGTDVMRMAGLMKRMGEWYYHNYLKK